MTRPESTTTSGSPSAGALIPQPYRVLGRRRETVDTFTLRLAPVGKHRTFPFRPGQFNMLYAYGTGEAAISISGDPGEADTLVHTIRAVGSVTRILHQVRRGDVVGVRGPFGTHWPVVESEGQDIVIVAGGIGLAPLRPALYHILRHRRDYGHVVLLYGTRSPADILFLAELKRWRSRFDLETAVTVDRAAAGWSGNVGVVTTLLPRIAFDPPNTVALVCGPEVMMRFTMMELRERGVATSSIYVSMERNMKCGIGLCGHCQLGPHFVCKDGPVFRLDDVARFFALREI